VGSRAFLEKLTHRLTFRRYLPRPFRPVRIYVSSEGGLRYLRPSMSSVDPDLLSLAAELVEPGDTVWDVGANIGLFSFAAAMAAGASGRVLALEPDTELVRLLRKSAGTNHDIAPVEILPAALMDEVGVGRFHIARRNRSTSHLDGFGTSQTGGVRSTELVPTVTLDWLADHFPLPRVLKIDVEAAELAVLRGGERVLSSWASAISFRATVTPSMTHINHMSGVPPRLRPPRRRLPFVKEIRQLRSTLKDIQYNPRQWP
jgi:FkbM family methyltransferase